MTTHNAAKNRYPIRETIRDGIMAEISEELEHAYRKHGEEQWGRHEFYAILKEEIDELWDAIKSDAHQNDVVAETIDVMAMCVRYLETGDRYRQPTKQHNEVKPNDTNR